jgi:hypothetical protein
MLRSMIEMNRILKQDKFCAIVVGNSSLEYELIESHKFFAEMSKDIGFKTIKTIFRAIDKTKKYTSADIGKIDDEFILILQKVEDINVSSENDVFISEIVTQQMKQFREKLKHSQGTSTKGKKPTKERLLKNIDKLDEAINKISKDIVWK